jgi:hypothetical protein
VRRLLDVWSEIQDGRGSGHEQDQPAEEPNAPVGDYATDLEQQERRGFGLGYAQELYWLTKRLVLAPNTYSKHSGLVFELSKSHEPLFTEHGSNKSAPVRTSLPGSRNRSS